MHPRASSGAGRPCSGCTARTPSRRSPTPSAPARTRHDVVERQSTSARPRSTHSSIRLSRTALVSSLSLPLRAARGCTCTRRITCGRANVSRRGVERHFVLLEDLRLALEHEHVGTPHRTHIERLVARVQDEDLAQSAPKGSLALRSRRLTLPAQRPVAPPATARSASARGRAASRTRAHNRGPGSRSPRPPNASESSIASDADWWPPVSS